jgi:glycosyltransferase involved in cell wall biosynthesis
VVDLARGLTRRSHDVHLYAAAGSDVAGVQVIDTRVDPAHLEATLYRASGAQARSDGPAVAAFSKAYTAIGRCHYDVVHNHAFDAPAVALATSLDVAVVHTLHLPPDRWVASAIRDVALGDRPPTVACVSEFQAGRWRQIVPVDAILRPFVPTASIPFSPASGDGALFAGRYAPEKGAAEAVEIARAAGVPIDLYGDGYDPDYVRRRIEPLRGVPGVAISAALPREALWAAFGQAAVVLCPADWDEPFGMAAAEAQACGTPVVAFRRGALPEVMVDGVTGFLIEPGDLDGAADAVRRVPTLDRRRCREYAESELDLERSIDAHERLYERVAVAGASARARG